MFSKKRRFGVKGRADDERKEPTLPTSNFGAANDTGQPDKSPKILAISDPQDAMPPATAASAPATQPQPEPETAKDDVITIGKGIADLLAEERMDLSASGKAAAWAEEKAGASGSAAQPEPSSYARPRNYGDEPALGNAEEIRHDAPRSTTVSEQCGERQFEPCTDLQRRLITQIAEVMWFPSGTDQAGREERLLDALDALQGIDPRDEMEGMLACQLVVTHRAALDCLQLSMAATTGSGDRTRIIDHVESLLTVYARNLETLDKHRHSQDRDHEARELEGTDESISRTLRTLRANSLRPARHTQH
jgi:hypothetical protein